MIDKLKPLLGKLCSFSQKRLGFSHPPKLFLKSDSENAGKILGKTAHYDPQNKSITLFTVGRHPKDILRSFSHELVHHAQNLRGDLAPEKMTSTGANYAQECPHMRNMEKEAYLKGNMCFRDWEDQYKLTESESKFLKENKTMTTKITKEFLRETIKKTIQEIGPIGAPEAKTDEETLRAAKATLNMVGRNSAITPDVIKANMTAAANVGTEEGLKIAKALAQYIMKKVRDTDARIAAGDVMKQSAPEAPAGSKASRAIADLYSDRVKQAKALTGKLFEDEEEASEELEENEELEEGGKYDDEDGKDEKCDYVPCKESKIQTPEQENTLYEQRFTPKNNRLFEKLLKEWTK